MESASEGKLRPRLLVLLCWLSFFGGSWSLMSNFTNYQEANHVSELNVQAVGQTRDRILRSAPSSERKSVERILNDFSILSDTVRIKQNALFGMMSNLLTLVGAFLMYRLRRKGLGIYVLGMAVYVATPLVVYGADNLAGLSFFVFSLAISLTFTTLYYKMLKYMD